MFKTRALIESVKRFIEVDFFVLVIDGVIPEYNDACYLDLGFLKSDISKLIIKKYRNKSDKLRWALKPAFMAELLSDTCETLIYTDNDIYFYSSPEFLFKKLIQSDILLTPQNYSFDPTKNQTLFEANLWCGLYNAGFIGASRNGLAALNWWSECCHYNMKKVAWRGLFDDQKYLDLMPVIFKNIEVLKHKGCNIAGWNQENNMRTLNNQKEVIIEPDFPIVFIHFTPLFFENMSKNLDVLLSSHYDEYQTSLLKFNPNFLSHNEFNKVKYWNKYFLRYCIWLIFYFIENYSIKKMIKFIQIVINRIYYKLLLIQPSTKE